MTYVVNWGIFDSCNFKCSYCMKAKRRDKAGRSLSAGDKERLARTAERIGLLMRRMDGIDAFSLVIIGGEATLLEAGELLALIGILCRGAKEGGKRIASVHITSNFSAPVEWYAEVCGRLAEDRIRFSLTLSYHAEHFTWERFAEKYSRLLSIAAPGSPRSFRIETVATKANIGKEAREAWNGCKKRGWPLTVDYNHREEWSAEEKSLAPVNKPAAEKERVMKSYLESTRGFLCSGTEYMARIMSNGDIRGACTSSMAGNIWSSESIDRRSVVCPRGTCPCCGRKIVRRPDGSIFYDSVSGGRK